MVTPKGTTIILKQNFILGCYVSLLLYHYVWNVFDLVEPSDTN